VVEVRPEKIPAPGRSEKAPELPELDMAPWLSNTHDAVAHDAFGKDKDYVVISEAPAAVSSNVMVSEEIKEDFRGEEETEKSKSYRGFFDGAISATPTTSPTTSMPALATPSPEATLAGPTMGDRAWAFVKPVYFIRLLTRPFSSYQLLTFALHKVPRALTNALWSGACGVRTCDRVGHFGDSCCRVHWT
jgi:hypothetical protein